MRRRAHVAWRGFSGPSPAVDISLEVMGSPPPPVEIREFLATCLEWTRFGYD